MGERIDYRWEIMNTVMQWFSMGGYAGYVWSAYGLVFTVFLLNGLGCGWQRNRIKKALQTWFKQTSI